LYPASPDCQHRQSHHETAGKLTYERRVWYKVPKHPDVREALTPTCFAVGV